MLKTRRRSGLKRATTLATCSASACVSPSIPGPAQRASSRTSVEADSGEQISAFGTVGLSTATTTAGLSVPGKLWIVATMYVGRLGPLTLASFAIYRRTSRITFPEGKVMIG